jgi:hypothetical protein
LWLLTGSPWRVPNRSARAGTLTQIAGRPVRRRRTTTRTTCEFNANSQAHNPPATLSHHAAPRPARQEPHAAPARPRSRGSRGPHAAARSPLVPGGGLDRLVNATGAARLTLGALERQVLRILNVADFLSLTPRLSDRRHPASPQPDRARKITDKPTTEDNDWSHRSQRATPPSGAPSASYVPDNATYRQNKLSLVTPTTVSGLRPRSD